MKRAVLTRLQDDGKQTLGELSIYDGLLKVFSCKTLEPAWKNNQRNISCIPAGRYGVALRSSAKYKQHFHVKNVPERSYILIHKGNFRRNTEGCVLVGRDFQRIDSDNLLDVTSSNATMQSLLSLLKNDFCLDVIGVIDEEKAD
jgi:hypothetical protein